jgi:hypothetical protein
MNIKAAAIIAANMYLGVIIYIFITIIINRITLVFQHSYLKRTI